MSNHYFCTTGVQATAIGPTKSQLDTAATATAIATTTTFTNGTWTESTLALVSVGTAFDLFATGEIVTINITGGTNVVTGAYIGTKSAVADTVILNRSLKDPAGAVGTNIAGNFISSITRSLYKNVRILRAVVRKYPTTASVVTVSDESATTRFTFTVPLVATIAPSYEFGGIPCPSGGFFVKVTNDADLSFHFDGDASIA